MPSTVESSGFSIIRCLPARIAASAGSRCSADGVVMHTASSPGCASRACKSSLAKPMPCSLREGLGGAAAAADHADQPAAARRGHGARVEVRDGARADETEA